METALSCRGFKGGVSRLPAPPRCYVYMCFRMGFARGEPRKGGGGEGGWRRCVWFGGDSGKRGTYAGGVRAVEGGAFADDLAVRVDLFVGLDVAGS